MAQSVTRAMQNWQPQKYLKFQRQRLRPALDLLARVSGLLTPNEATVEIIDLGAGTGNMAPTFLYEPQLPPLPLELMLRLEYIWLHNRQRWPNAHVMFIDSSPSMLEVAQREHKENESLDTQPFTYVQADFEAFEPERPVDLIFSNAALQWPGGVLAFQIPDNRLQPTHQNMINAADRLGLSDRVAGVRWVTCEKDPHSYYELFKGPSVELDMWAAIYAHVLEGDNPVVDFTSSTALRLYMKALNEPSMEATRFEDKYREYGIPQTERWQHHLQLQTPHSHQTAVADKNTSRASICFLKQ